VDNVILTLIN